MKRALERKDGYWNKGPGITGDLTGITGDIGGCEITDEERDRGVDISELIKEAKV